MNFLDHFRLKEEQENFEVVIGNISKEVVFRGTNLWILVFAIFIASLGLNVNSTAVIIGAMLVSPLMGPIIGMGMAMGINDLTLLKKALFNYLLAAGIGLVTSTIYFSISPLNEAHSEILARTAPNIYDVLIALFGGLAGVLAYSSRQKGNVIPGVAIATALMPPLCTAGYGLATFKFSFFLGASYLFIINTVFIALAALIVSRVLKFPYKHLPERKDEVRASRIIWGVVLITLLPSIYFGYDIVEQSKFEQRTNSFIENEAIFPNDYLLKKTIDARKKLISLTYGGAFIEDSEINKLRSKLKQYQLDGAQLEIRQGFAYLQEKNDDHESLLTLALNEKDKHIQELTLKIDSIASQNKLGIQVFKELKAQYPELISSVIQPAYITMDSTQKKVWISSVKMKGKLSKKEKERIEKWMGVRIGTDKLKLLFEE